MQNGDKLYRANGADEVICYHFINSSNVYNVQFTQQKED